MNDSLIENLTSQATAFYGPMGKINALMMSNIEKVAEFQLGAMKSYAELAMKQVKQVAEVRDLESLKTFGTSQSEVASEISKKIVEDMKALGEMGVEFKSQIEEIVSEAKNPAKDATEKPKAKAKAATASAQKAEPKADAKAEPKTDAKS
ncbi:phasin family protein [Alkalimarinus alittae]|uniref:Phasin family protein n=1 Tax=Alkalimarinus alittae TaxID=2961619 RepID=A0ABY6N6X6_9ALTE|nr:phasin family protein [Alkalimarinus alittae]UZE97846.1 phasin family protein [Alkalimarinus alittae]